jgi:hypothetical protein
MTTGMTLLEAAGAAQEALDLIAAVLQVGRDFTPAEAHQLVRTAVRLQCHAYELERVAMGIPKPKRG